MFVSRSGKPVGRGSVETGWTGVESPGSPRSPGPRQSSSDPSFSFLAPPVLERGGPETKPRHPSSNYPAGLKPRPPLHPPRTSKLQLETVPVRLEKNSSVEPAPVYQYSSSDESLKEPVLTRLRYIIVEPGLNRRWYRIISP